MPASIMPPAQEWARLTPHPGTITWRRASDARLLPAAGYALLLQVSHPTVGAGVTEHSQFQRDPWGRLWRTLDYTYTMVYGGPEAAAQMGRQIRLLHRRIRGTMPDGKPYRALEPEAYAWVHATLAEAIVAAHARFGRPFTERAAQPLLERVALARQAARNPRRRAAGGVGRVPGLLRRHGRAHARAHDRGGRSARRPGTPRAARHRPRAARLPGRWHGGRSATSSRSRAQGSCPRFCAAALASAGRLRMSSSCARSAPALRSATPLTPPWLRNTGPGYLRWRERATAPEPRS